MKKEQLFRSTQRKDIQWNLINKMMKYVEKYDNQARNTGTNPEERAEIIKQINQICKLFGYCNVN